MARRASPGAPTTPAPPIRAAPVKHRSFTPRAAATSSGGTRPGIELDSVTKPLISAGSIPASSQAARAAWPTDRKSDVEEQSVSVVVVRDGSRIIKQQIKNKIK